MPKKDCIRIEFEAMEFQADGSFIKMLYSYEGSEERGWKISRANEPYLSLPAGYRLLKTVYCGICSTDIARANLPFPLPQITGHEIVALDDGNPVVVEINASHHALGIFTDCNYCNNGLANHCPDRLTLGIDRLPGGFSPYLLAPKNSIIPIPEGMDLKVAAVAEPLAAAIRAVEKTPLEGCESVAVVGPRRLGSLLLLALNYYREKVGLQFKLTAIIRNPINAELCVAAGADYVLQSKMLSNEKFDAVFDTSGSQSGFELSLDVAQKYVHLKSTNGQGYEGLNVLTELVIDEISVRPLTSGELNSKFFQGVNLLVAQCLLDRIDFDVDVYSVKDKLFYESKSGVAQYDAVLLSDIKDLNTLLTGRSGRSLIKPEGNVFVIQDNDASTENSLQKKLMDNNLCLITSRCGDFEKAVKLLESEKTRLEKFMQYFLSNISQAELLNETFQMLNVDKSCVKAIVEHDLI